MAEYKVTLSIGYSGAVQEDIIEVDDDELADCETEYERQDLLNEYWRDWAGSYIEGDITPAEEDDNE